MLTNKSLILQPTFTTIVIISYCGPLILILGSPSRVLMDIIFSRILQRQMDARQRESPGESASGCQTADFFWQLIPGNT